MENLTSPVTKELDVSGLRQLSDLFLDNWLEEIAARKVAVERKERKPVKFTIEDSMKDILKASNEIMQDAMLGRVHAMDSSGKLTYTF